METAQLEPLERVGGDRGARGGADRRESEHEQMRSTIRDSGTAERMSGSARGEDEDDYQDGETREKLSGFTRDFSREGAVV